MTNSAEEKKLPLLRIAEVSLDYCLDNWRAVGGFVLVNMIFLLVAVQLRGGYANPLFLIWVIFYYIFWCYFFRFYFNRKPYLMFGKIFDSLVPSTKMLVLTLVFALILAALPFIPLFMGMSPDNADEYIYFLKKYMQESRAVDLGINAVLLLVSPMIFFRPFMAWISSVIGRSGLLKTAFAKTEGNYWRFVVLVAVFNIIFVGFEVLYAYFALPDWSLVVIYAPLVVYFNVVVAKSYDFFFLDLDTE